MTLSLATLQHTLSVKTSGGDAQAISLWDRYLATQLKVTARGLMVALENSTDASIMRQIESLEKSVETGDRQSLTKLYYEISELTKQVGRHQAGLQLRRGAIQSKLRKRKRGRREFVMIIF